jgi:hypothetical protein
MESKAQMSIENLPKSKIKILPMKYKALRGAGRIFNWNRMRFRKTMQRDKPEL